MTSEQPIRILQVVTNMSYGGLENFIMNNYRNVDRTRVQFDFLTHFAGHQDYEEEIAALGGKLYRLPKLDPFSRSYLSDLKSFFKAHPEYKVVHSHLNCISSVPLKAAMECGVPVRIAHSHNTTANHDLKYLIKMACRKKIPDYTTDLFACGEEAGKWLFGSNSFKVIKNSINTEQYIFDQEKAFQVRESLGLTDNFVIGHVGMFREQKNHPFLFEITKALAKRDPSVKLVSVGNGPLFESMQEKAKETGAADNILFLGGRSDVPDLMQAMDAFVLPSLFEGFPVTMVEAQAAGLSCFISDKVPKECKMTPEVHTINLSSSADQWADAILKHKNTERKNNLETIKKAGFDIATNAKWLEDFYVGKHNGK